MASVMAFDPSTRSTGWSFWMNGELRMAGVLRAKNLEAMMEMLLLWEPPRFVYDVVAVERPEIYTPTKAVANPNKVQQLSIVAGACAMRAGWTGKLLMPYPQQWKGSVPKHVTEMQMKRKVGGQWAEIEKILNQQLKTSRDDVADAIALGVWAHEKERLSILT